MKRFIINVIIAFAVALLPRHFVLAQGEITYLSNLGQTSTGSVGVGNNSWLAADFITGNNANGYVLNFVQLAMLDAPGNPSGFTAMIYSANIGSGIVPGSSLEALSGALNPATAGIYAYTTVSSVTLSPNTDYFIVLTAGTSIANGAYEWSLAGTYSYNPSDGWGVGGNHGQVANYWQSTQGLTWIGNSGNIQFALNATAVPEPSPVMLLGFGGILLLGFGRWKATTV